MQFTVPHAVLWSCYCQNRSFDFLPYVCYWVDFKARLLYIMVCTVQHSMDSGCNNNKLMFCYYATHWNKPPETENWYIFHLNVSKFVSFWIMSLYDFFIFSFFFLVLNIIYAKHRVFFLCVKYASMYMRFPFPRTQHGLDLDVGPLNYSCMCKYVYDEKIAWVMRNTVLSLLQQKK